MAKVEGKHWCFFAVVVSAVLLASVVRVLAFTDPEDVIALQDLYRALNNPQQLKGWKLDGGDPCQESWTGVSCYGSSVIYLKLQGLNLTGSIGGLLHFLYNLKHLDVSSNYIVGPIPYGLPPNATHINLACNNLTENIPHSLKSINLLRHLNLSHNSFSGPIGDVFAGLLNLKELDLSFNKFSGDLPSSFGSLANLSALFLQDNQFTGSVIYLADLPLTDLNIQSNHFSGVIPAKFQSIPNLWIDGNNFHTVSNYPPWNYPLDNLPLDRNFTGPPTSESSAIENYPSLIVAGHKKKSMGPGGIAFTVGGVTLVATCAAIYIAIRIKRSRPFPASRRRECTPTGSEGSPQLLPIKAPSFLGPRHTSSIYPTRTETMPKRRSFAKQFKAPVCGKLYAVAELQLATNSFSEGNRLGEGSLGSVYKAEFPDGQIFAVKNINMVSLSFQEEERFLEVIWTLSRLRHPNIVTLLGYCVEQGQHLLVYEYVRNLSLEDVLHNGSQKPLSWNKRLSIALGVARGLDYLHSAFSPPVSHGNIKAANILLDKHFLPRICDSGLAILRPLTSNSVKLKASEIAIADTGYIAPENGEPGSDNTKSDVYSFGVLMLELLTGRKPFDGSRPVREKSLVKWALPQLHDSECLAEMVDPGVKATIPARALSQFADIVSLCTQHEKLFRPPMSEIVESLAGLQQKFAMPITSAVDGADIDFERSFRSTHTCFMGSPALTHASA